jgi:beta-xylosidase
VLIERSQGMGEGSHIYKLKGKYYIVSAIPGAHVPMKCARADKITGPWEVETISALESLGTGQGYRPKGGRNQNPPFEINPPDLSERLSLDLHQGGIIDTPSGEWWGFSMQDHNSVGRLTSLSPVTWVDGWLSVCLKSSDRHRPGWRYGRVSRHCSLRARRQLLNLNCRRSGSGITFRKIPSGRSPK